MAQASGEDSKSSGNRTQKLRYITNLIFTIAALPCPILNISTSARLCGKPAGGFNLVVLSSILSLKSNYNDSVRCTIIKCLQVSYKKADLAVTRCQEDVLESFEYI